MVIGAFLYIIMYAVVWTGHRLIMLAGRNEGHAIGSVIVGHKGTVTQSIINDQSL